MSDKTYYEQFMDNLMEKRKGGHELNPRLNLAQELQPYLYNPEEYGLHFTDVKKVGVYPQARHTTPNGVYVFPLLRYKPVFLDSRWGMQSEKGKLYQDFKLEFPYGTNKKYIYVLRQNPSNKILDLQKNISDREYQSQIEKILPYIEKKYPYYTINKSFIDEARLEIEKNEANNSIKLYRFVDIALRHGIKELTFTNSSNLQNEILRVALGYDEVVDYGGGFIHPSEPYQTLYLHSKAYTIVSKHVNPSRDVPDVWSTFE